MTRTALADPNDCWPEGFTVTNLDRLTRLFGEPQACTICGHLSVNPTHPNCERPPKEEPHGS